MILLRRLLFLSLPPPYSLPSSVPLSPLTPSKLAYTLYKRFKIEIWTSVFLYLSDVMSKIGVSLMVGKLMSKFFEQKEEEGVRNVCWLIGFLLVHLAVGQHNWLILTKLSNGIKISMLYYLHRKIFSIPCYYLSRQNSNIYGLISSDIAQLENKATYLLALFMTPFTLLLSSLLLSFIILPSFPPPPSSLLYHPSSSSPPPSLLPHPPPPPSLLHHSSSSVFPLLLLLFSILTIFLVQFLLAKWNYAAFSKKSTFTQNRLKATHELIDHIRILRMLKLQSPFQKEIFNSRKKEVGSLAFLNLLLGANKLLAKLSPFLLMAFLLTFFSPSSTSISFRYSILHLFDFICLYTVMYFGLGLLTLLEFQVTFAKVAAILSLPENPLKIKNTGDQSRNRIGNKDEKDGKSEEEKNNQREEEDGKRDNKRNMLEKREKEGKKEEIVMELEEFSAGYEKGTEVFSNLNLTIRKGQKVAILGKVGSGKSSLLLSLIREIPIIKGKHKIKGRISFVQQNPFFLKGSIVENIAFQSKMEEKWMKEVIIASGLEKEVKEEGEREVGEKGEMLSGGQKARSTLFCFFN